MPTVRPASGPGSPADGARAGPLPATRRGIVKELVERDGGSAGAESGDDTTSFWFSLPA